MVMMMMMTANCLCDVLVGARKVERRKETSGGEAERMEQNKRRFGVRGSQGGNTVLININCSVDNLLKCGSFVYLFLFNKTIALFTGIAHCVLHLAVIYLCSKTVQ